MCGIIGIAGKGDVAPRLLEALQRLEYRGYDSAGMATLVNGHIERRRAEGKLANLRGLLARDPLPGDTGIGHTRWATHGRPSERNAHPHATQRVAVVHNGIIENFQALREELAGLGYRFETETDSEVIAHLITRYLEEQMSPEEAVNAALPRLAGAFALAIVFADRHGLLIGARRGCPLAIGEGDGEMFLGSDALALAPFTRRIAHLEEEDCAVITVGGAAVYNRGRRVERPARETALTGARIGKGNHRHYMIKEIAEQPVVIGDTLSAYLDPLARRIELPALPFDLGALTEATIVGCGTAYFAGMVGKYWFEQIARLPTAIDVASEFRYRALPMAPGGVTVGISQSGETADTLAALRYARSEGQRVVGVLNAPESTMARESDVVLPTLAGPEIGVASTKAFTTQLTVLACFAIAAARARGRIDAAREAELARALIELPGLVAELIAGAERIRGVAELLAGARDVLYLGRGTSYPIALEGALKLKEISYIHAEGYAAGEMKHGPIALIDETVPVVVLAPADGLFDKTASNLQEVAARGGRVILIAERSGIERLGRLVAATIELPAAHPFVTPILAAVPVQLLAYYAAVIRGTDVDQPRNLAKSVTVE